MHNFLARDMLQRLGHMRMRAVLVRRIVEADPVVVAPPQEVAKGPGTPKAVLIRVMAAADGSRAARQATGMDPGLSQNDDIRRAKSLRVFGAKSPDRERLSYYQQHLRPSPWSSGSVGVSRWPSAMADSVDWIC